ncbi:antibiotic biosynthesis monooxygenase [Winogradskyella sp.]|uniref:antibiotic biosynthesis monooxygenase family protein n=1 Tax=Winogradskyella sp. TaxID=1883156 RepID=UPI00262E49B7|nr:antibiotic biosynthesis monooxygenase [Winogradskyella sp.]
MYIILYTFNVIPNKEDDFIEGWKGLTEFIYKHEGSLGSRLHKSDEHNYLAYAQWPDKATFENSSGNLPVQAEHFRSLMRASCNTIDILNKLDVVEDLLKEKQQNA